MCVCIRGKCAPERVFFVYGFRGASWPCGSLRCGGGPVIILHQREPPGPSIIIIRAHNSHTNQSRGGLGLAGLAARKGRWGGRRLFGRWGWSSRVFVGLFGPRRRGRVFLTGVKRIWSVRQTVGDRREGGACVPANTRTAGPFMLLRRIPLSWTGHQPN